MIDLLHQPLSIGDKVVVSNKHGYAGLRIVSVLAFTNKHVRTTNGLYPPDEVLKVNEQCSIAIDLNPDKFI